MTLQKSILTVAVGATTMLGGGALAYAQGNNSDGQGWSQGGRPGNLGLHLGNNGNQANQFGQRPGNRGPGSQDGQRRPGNPIMGMAMHLGNVDFDTAGITKPAFWDNFISWLQSEDVKTVGVWLMENRPEDGFGGPLGAMQAIDFSSAGVSQPSWWGDMITWFQSDDAEALKDARPDRPGHPGGDGNFFMGMTTRLEKVDFEGAGVAQPSFWNDMISWLQSDDAKTVAIYMFQNRPDRPEGGQFGQPGNNGRIGGFQGPTQN